MLLVLASRSDQMAAEFARASSGQARLVTAADLSMPGWSVTVPAQGPSAAVIGNELISSEAITGVLVRLDVVRPHELSQVIPADRTYVAAEMTAFLRYWLSALECPVLNPPNGSCLSGPGWPPDQWIHAAIGAGLRAHRATPGNSTGTVTVVGNTALGPPQLHDSAVTLARATRTPFLEVIFQGTATGPMVVGANPWPDIGRAPVADAIWQLIGKEAEC